MTGNWKLTGFKRIKVETTPDSNFRKETPDNTTTSFIKAGYIHLSSA